MSGGSRVGTPKGALLACGSRSRVYAWGEGAVVKVPDLTTPTDWIPAEARYTEAVYLAGAPSPRLLGIEMIQGRACGVYERIDGTSMWQHVIQNPSQAAHFGAVLANLQAHLFSLVPPVLLPRQCDRLRCKIRRAARDVDPYYSETGNRFPETSTRLRLCHGDLHPGNVILSGRGPVIVDWFDVAIGDPVADVARTSLLLRADGNSCPPHLPGSDRMLLRAFEAAYLDRIAEVVAPDPRLLQMWQTVETIARLGEDAPPARSFGRHTA